LLRGSSFAEKRVIDLMNARYVSFYFCFRKGTNGYDEDAAALYNESLKEDADFKAGLPPVVLYAPDGLKSLKSIPREVQFDKDKFHDALRDALREHPAYDAPAPEEKKLLAAAEAAPRDAAAHYRAGEARERAAAPAAGLYEKAIAAAPESEWAARAHLRLATMARHARAWDDAEKRLESAEAVNAGDRFNFADDVAMERAHRQLADQKHAKALELLDAAIRASPASNRMGELRFYAGVANFFLAKRDWAHYHWWWVLENIPEDHHVLRCSVALTAEGNCFANPELAGFAGAKEMTISDGAAARDVARSDYDRLKDKYAP